MSAGVRTAAPADRAAVEALLRAAGLPVEGLDDQFDEGYAVAQHDTHIVGAAGVETYGPYGLLRSVVVTPAARGRGIAAALLTDRLAWARTHGLEAVYLLTTTAEPYFASHGFNRVARDDVPAEVKLSGEFATICPDSAAVMALQLARVH